VTIEAVTVVGAGTMGNGIAHLFALHGHPVTLIDSDPVALRKGMEAIERNLDRQVAKNAISTADRDAALGRIDAQEDLESAHAADLVVEAIGED
jgi:3-hydroxybutyryl-CoA dehydrogenase